MATQTNTNPMQVLPRPGQKVCWRDPRTACVAGWEGTHGLGPFEVVRLVDHSGQGLATGLVVRTLLGEPEISEVWLALADETVGSTRDTLAS